MNKWERIRNYFIMLNFDENIKRKVYLKFMKKWYRMRPITCDNCRCILMTAGYLKRVKRGVYKKINCIPRDLTYMQARYQAYPPLNILKRGD